MDTKIKHYCNSLDISKEYKEIFGKDMPNGKMFCPFHENHDTPAAKRYDNSIVCFSCNRTYRTYDLLYKFNYEKIKYIMNNYVLDDVKEQNNTIKYDIIDIDRNDSISNVLNKIEDIWQKNKNLD